MLLPSRALLIVIRDFCLGIAYAVRKAMQRSLSRVSYNDIVALDEKLANLHYRRQSVLNDGDCFYLAVSHQLSLLGDPIPPEQIRKMSVEFLRENDEIGEFCWFKAVTTRETKESYLQHHSCDGVFADDVMTQAAASALGYEIIIITATEKILIEPYCPQIGEVAIARVNGKFYISLDGEGKKTSSDATHLFSLQGNSAVHGILKQTQEKDPSEATRSYSPVYELSEGKKEVILVGIWFIAFSCVNNLPITKASSSTILCLRSFLESLSSK